MRRSQGSDMPVFITIKRTTLLTSAALALLLAALALLTVRRMN